MKKTAILEALRNAASFFLLLMGTFTSVIMLMLAYMAFLGNIPIWHPPLACLISLAALTASYLLS